MKPVETRAFEIGFKRPPCMRRSGVLSMSGCFFCLDRRTRENDLVQEVRQGDEKIR